MTEIKIHIILLMKILGLEYWEECCHLISLKIRCNYTADYSVYVSHTWFCLSHFLRPYSSSDYLHRCCFNTSPVIDECCKQLSLPTPLVFFSSNSYFCWNQICRLRTTVVLLRKILYWLCQNCNLGLVFFLKTLFKNILIFVSWQLSDTRTLFYIFIKKGIFLLSIWILKMKRNK